MPKATLKIACLGAGNLAHHLIPSLYKADYSISQVYSRNINNAKELAKSVDAKATNDLSQIDSTADIYILAVPDHAIATVSDHILKLPIKSTAIITHSSGATSSIVLSEKTNQWGIFYALDSFSKEEITPLDRVPFLIHAANNEISNTLTVMAKDLSSFVIAANDETRLKYHLAAVFINNFVNHLHCKVSNWLDLEGLDSTVLDPIIHTTFDKIVKQNPCDVQTGPALRNDQLTIEKHEALLENDLALKTIYSSMTKSIQNKYQ